MDALVDLCFLSQTLAGVRGDVVVAEVVVAEYTRPYVLY
jgi:hypothetical protein